MFKLNNKCLKIFILFSLFFSNIALPWPKISSFVPKIFAKKKVVKPAPISSFCKKLSKKVAQSLTSVKKVLLSKEFLTVSGLTLAYFFIMFCFVFCGINWEHRGFRPAGKNSIFKFFSLRRLFTAKNVAKIKELFNKVDDINAEYSLGYAPIHYACKYDNVEILKWLVKEKRADVNNVIKSQNSGGGFKWINRDNIPLHIACKNGHLDCITFLVEKGANVHKQADGHKDAIDYACKNNRMDIFMFLADKVGNYEAMARACHFLNVEMIRYLVEEKGTTLAFYNLFSPDIDFSQKEKHDGQFNVIRYILGRGFGINKVTSFDKRLIHYAAEKENIRLMWYLIKNGAAIESGGYDDVDNILHERYRRGKEASPLYCACKDGKLGSIKVFLMMGAYYYLSYSYLSYGSSWINDVRSAKDPENKVYKFLKDIGRKKGDFEFAIKMVNKFEDSKKRSYMDYHYLKKVKDAFLNEPFLAYEKREYMPDVFALHKKDKTLISEDELKVFLSKIRFDEKFVIEEKCKEAADFAQKHTVVDVIGNTVETAKFLYLSPPEKHNVMGGLIDDIWNNSKISLFDQWRILRKKRKKSFVPRFFKRKKKEKIDFEKYSLFKIFDHMERAGQINPYAIRNKLRKTEVPNARQNEASTLPDEIVENIMSFVG
ncbi:ankyrin repeat domain-containing protein [Candidatus Dependentiae bacterium]